MAPCILPSDVPTLTQLYTKKALKTSSLPLVPGPNPDHNDHIGVVRADITKLKVDAIVNAANSSLRGGGGVDGAIHRAAGPSLLKECAKIGGCETGDAVITDAYELPCRHVIHTVGPVYRQYSPKRAKSLLESCYAKCLELAVQKGLKTIAFCGISTGVYGYPATEGAMVASESVKRFLEDNEGEGEDGPPLDKVIFVVFNSADSKSYDQALPRVFPPLSEEA